MIIHRGFRFKLSPTDEQEILFFQFAGVCRLVYNLALEQRETWWRQFRRNTGRSIGWASQSLEVTNLRAEFDWIAAVNRSCIEQALHDLDQAFSNFFSGRAAYPTYRQKGVNDAFRLQGKRVQIKNLNAKWSAVRLPSIGWVRFRDTRAVIGKINSVTVSHDVFGWHVSFACAIEHEAPANPGAAVGIDRGVANTLALSTGEMLSVPASLSAIDRRHRSAQRALARKKRGSKRRAKALRRCSRLSARRARIRRDFHHRAALSIVQRFGVVVLEDLNVKNMTASAKGTVEQPGQMVRQKAGLNRSILNQGWGIFETILAYKLEERGGRLIKVDPAYTSQTCSACGCIDKRSRESQARFVCQHCGHEIHADTNAAIEILRRSTVFTRMEEGQAWPSDEVRTRGMREHPENLLASAGGRC